MIDEYYTFLIFGYHSDDLKPHSSKYIVDVCDKCGLYRSLRMSQYTQNNDLCQACANKHRFIIPNEPLPDGWKSKLSYITTNKECSTYLGSIAETILANIYNDVQVMPYSNPGYDVICNRDFKIDIKSAATGDKRGYWQFAIHKNIIADYFLCIAFNNRDDLYNPVHLWIIPGHKVKHLQTLRISKTTIDKWNEYELSLDKLVACCDNLSV